MCDPLTFEGHLAAVWNMDWRMGRRGSHVAVGLEEERAPCKHWRPTHPARGFPESMPVSPPRLQSVGDQPVSELPRVTAS